MISTAVFCFWITVGIVAVYVVAALGFAVVPALARPKSCPTARCPKTAVVLCLRGADPFLETCIRALVEQDYPCFEVRIVVDDEQDPAWDVVRRVIDGQSASRVVAAPLKHVGTACSLKCSAVVQAVSELDESFEVIALLDADTIPHPTWLRELVAPLEDPNVGAVTGNRWYMPEDPNFGSLVRYVWNAAAVILMYWLKIAWGGTLAVKRSAIERADLPAKWRNAFCEDTMLFRMLRKQGLRQVFVPSLMMVNRESCDLSGFCRWVSRQLLTARLYHPGWPVVVLHGLGSSILPLITLGVLLAALVRQEYAAVAWSLAALVLFELGSMLVLVAYEGAMRRAVAQRGESTRWLTPAGFVLFPLAVIATQMVYPVTLLRAMLVRKVEWRGVNYRIDGPWDIRLEAHRPFMHGARADVRHSL
jgi:Glycosyltransferase like family 2